MLDQPDALPQIFIKFTALAGPVLIAIFFGFLALSIVIPVLVLLKADGLLPGASWGAVLTPVWVACTVAVAVLAFLALWKSPVELTDEEVDAANDETPIKHSPLMGQRYDDATMDDSMARSRLRRGVYFRPLFALKTLLLIGFLALLACAGDGRLPGPYAPLMVCAPLFVWSVLSLVQTMVEWRSVFSDQEARIARAAYACGGPLYVIGSRLYLWATGTLQVLLWSLRSAQLLEASYWVVLLPLLVLSGLGLLMGCLNCCAAHSNENDARLDDSERAQVGVSQVLSFGTALLSAPLLTTVCLLAAKLEQPAAFSWGVVAIPVLVVLAGVLLCCGLLVVMFHRMSDLSWASAGASEGDDEDAASVAASDNSSVAYQTFSTPPPPARASDDAV